MDTELAIASKRDERRYDGRPVPDDVAERILDAGRLAGSARNQQPTTMHVLADRLVRQEAAMCTHLPGNVAMAGLAVALTVSGTGGLMPFDAGRAAQNMMLAAWNQGVVSCPNGVADPGRLARVLGLGEHETPVVIISFGYPPSARRPERRTREAWSARARRAPLDDVVHRH